MFKLAKYYLLANIYKRAKFSVLMVFASIIAMLIISFVFSDIVTMTDGSPKVLVVSVKWLLLLSLIGVTIFHLQKIVRSASFSFAEDSSMEVVLDEKKARVMEKAKLRSRSEIIIDKYREAG